MRILSFLLLACMLGGALQAQEIKVATYNLRMDTPNDSLNAWSYRKDKVRALISYHDFDIVGTQEGFKHQLEDIATLDHFAYVGVGRDDGKEAGEHSAIFYNTKKFKKLNEGTFWLSETPSQVSYGWGATINRVCSWVRLKTVSSGKELYVFNVHYDHRSKQAREESSKLLIRKIKEIAPKSANIIITGDFNAIPDSEPIQVMKEAYSSSRDVSTTKPYGPLHTINNRFQSYVPLKNSEIDYIFVNKGTKVSKYAVISDAQDGFYPSDHLPVVAVVKLN